ncbi:gram-negative porin family protein [Burkholderia cenocepacia]|uniref:Gram-negative porin family protein n=1 Tax=Burkholderia cenocepacia TaxID=95486 RepID=A0AAN0S0G4_9BURK|nr:gram-negative porin family protein [Burkholderia cenocepacia]
MLKGCRSVLCAAGWATGMAVCAAVHAQGSVTLYGMIDTGLLYTTKALDAVTGGNAGKQWSMIDGGSTYSHFGIMGAEDLGGGLQAGFKLESGISLPSGGLAHCNGNLFGCEAWISVNSPYGEVKAGLQFSPFFLAVYETDPRNLSFFGSGGVNLVGNLFGTSIFTAGSVSYASPERWGLQGRVLYAFGGKPDDFQAGRQYSASLKYENNNVLIVAAIFSGNSDGANVTPIPSDVAAEARLLGSALRLGAVTLKASFVNYKVAGSFNNNVYGGGLSWYVTPALDLDGGVWVTGDRNHTANHSVLAALGANYFVSKRTALYAQLAAVNNHGAMDTGLSVNGALFGTHGTTLGATAGIRHSF